MGWWAVGRGGFCRITLCMSLHTQCMYIIIHTQWVSTKMSKLIQWGSTKMSKLIVYAHTYTVHVHTHTHCNFYVYTWTVYGYTMICTHNEFRLKCRNSLWAVYDIYITFTVSFDILVSFYIFVETHCACI